VPRPTKVRDGEPPLAASLTLRAGALEEHLRPALAGDGRGVHQARVATRRLREVTPVAIDVRHGRGARLMRRLRRLTRAVGPVPLGPVRELDVALTLVDARAVGRSAPGAVALRAHLTALRAEAFESLTDVWDSARARRLLAKLMRLRDEARAEPVTADGALRPRVRRALTQGLLDRAKALRRAVDDSGALLIVERIHAVRIAAKRLRYALELAGELQLLRTAALVSSLRAVQDALGELHDLDVLRRHAARVLRQVPADSIVARDLDAMVLAIDADLRHLHARYLRSARGLVRLTDRVQDRVTPCLAPSIST
jgi:CHAD domain-containing protein